MSMPSFDAVPAHQRGELLQYVEDCNKTASLRMYNDLLDDCFDKCVNNFSGKTLDEKETKCMAHCSEKFLKLTQRVGFRFSEYQAINHQIEKSLAK